MKKWILIIAIIFSILPVLYSQNLSDTSVIEKTGWLVFKEGHVIWFEAALKRNVTDKSFFIPYAEYLNGLVVDYIPIAKYYKSIANLYEVNALSYYDTISKKADYMLLDSVRILPVNVRLKRTTKPVSELLTPMGLSFKRGSREITLRYNFETNYDISEIRLLRKRDKRRIKRVKDYLVDPTN
jgi:hypothetical protein